ncbi:hypothetical protein ONA02_04375 [Mycoplasmopsis felis]|nr:hypothetical protein [Mycoplasmopsis felis]WAM01869.1 hypothetical protein ONA02_04375 [Mycoplasmopsis felis]
MSPEDFYLGILRTYLSDDSSYRINNGGSAELDKLANQKYAVDGTNHFKENKDEEINIYMIYTMLI